MERNIPRIDRVRLNAALRVIEHYSNSTPESIAAIGLEDEALVGFMADQFVQKVQLEFEEESPEYAAEMHRKALFDEMMYSNAGLTYLRTEAKRLGVSTLGDIKTVLFTVLREGARFHRDNFVPEIPEEAPEMLETERADDATYVHTIDFVITGDEQPYVWDEKRRAKFRRRALANGNLPKAFHPDGDDDVLEDALIGKLADNVESMPRSERRDELLELIAFTIEVLSGEDMDIAKEHYSKNKYIRKKGAAEAYLSVAGLGARLYRDEFFDASITKPISEAVTPDLTEVVPRVAPPTNALIDIHHQGKLTAGQVTALLVLMGEPVPASSSVKLAPIIAGAGREINTAMAYRPVNQPARQAYEHDAVLARGKDYLRILVELANENPDSDVRGTEQVVIRLISGAGISADDELFKQVKKHVDSHVSYALTAMYELK